MLAMLHVGVWLVWPSAVADNVSGSVSDLQGCWLPVCLHNSTLHYATTTPQHSMAKHQTLTSYKHPIVQIHCKMFQTTFQVQDDSCPVVRLKEILAPSTLISAENFKGYFSYYPHLYLWQNAFLSSSEYSITIALSKYQLKEHFNFRFWLESTA